MTFPILALIAISIPTVSNELNGSVVDQSGTPVANATVVIAGIQAKHGGLPRAEVSFNEFGRRAQTDPAGQFSFGEVDGSVDYELAVVAKGHRDRILDFELDEDAKFVAELASIDAPMDRIVLGQVLDDTGKPVAGAIVTPRSFTMGNRITGRNDGLVTPVAITDEDGMFTLGTQYKVSRFALRVRAPFTATTQVGISTTQMRPTVIEIGRGASVRGRLVLGRIAQPGIRIGLLQKDRRVGNIVTPRVTITDHNGVFEFDHIPPNIEYAIYTLLHQGAACGLPVSFVSAPGHGKRAELGDVQTQMPNRFRIKVISGDRQEFPEGSLIYVGRRNASNGPRLVPEGTEAQFDILDACNELFEVSVRIPGYRVLRTVPFKSADLNGRLRVLVNGDTSLTVVVTKENPETDD